MILQIRFIVCIPTWATLLGFLISISLTHLISEGKDLLEEYLQSSIVFGMIQMELFSQKIKLLATDIKLNFNFAKNIGTDVSLDVG